MLKYCDESSKKFSKIFKKIVKKFFFASNYQL